MNFDSVFEYKKQPCQPVNGTKEEHYFILAMTYRWQPIF